jgi:pimeloyl-ACP methyl ester carboxylesterase
MMSSMADMIDLTVDVTDSAGLAEPLQTRATVTLPDPATLGAPPVVCFGFPGGGYSRGYFTFDMPDGSARGQAGGQAAWHAQRGWIFVSCDHLFVGESSAPTDPTRLTFGVVAAANAATVAHVTSRLAHGTVSDGFPPVRDAVLLGIGQSMGGCFTIVQQGRHATYDGIAALGFSAIQTTLAFPPGTPSDADAFAPRDDGLPIVTWCFHYDDEPPDLVDQDMRGYPVRERMPVWGSATVPPCAFEMLQPGCVRDDAAAITVPVLVGVGERDVVPDPRAEPKAYAQSPDITVLVCPGMSHMHNFASTRESFWQRLQDWGDSVARQKPRS